MKILPKISKKLTNITTIILAILIILPVLPVNYAQADNLTFTNLTVEVLNDAQVHISWNTNYPAFYLLEYGLTNTYGLSMKGVKAKNNQEIYLENLEPETKYHFHIIAYTDNDLRTVTFDQAFVTTKNIDTDKPEMLEFRLPLITSNAAYFYIQTDEKVTTYLTYWVVSTATKTATKSVYSNDNKWADGTITNLQPNTSYAYTITLKDKAGNITKYNERNFTTASNNFVLNDFNITNITPVDNNSSLIGDNNITVQFKTTRPAICTVRNQKINGGGNDYKELDKKNWEHEFIIDNLETNTNYAYRIECTDFLNVKTHTNWFYYQTSGPVILGYDTASDPDVKIFSGYNFTLMRAEDDDKVYAVFTRQKYWIRNPAILKSYGLENEPIKVVSRAKIDNYIDLKIIQDPKTGDKYYLYSAMNRKKKINSEKVNRSYEFNKTTAYIVINDFDFQSYENVNLIKTPDNPTIYLIYGDTKRPISSWDVFLSRGWQPWEIGLVNQIDLNSYNTAATL